MLEFTAAADFRFNQHNASAAAAQTGQAGDRFYTTSQQFVDQALNPNPQQFRITKTAASLKCLPPTGWADAKVTGRRVLFLLPSQALGNNVATLLFLQAFAEQRRPRSVGVFCARSAADIYLTSDLARVYTIWIARRELKKWDMVIDLGQLESRRNIDLWPVDMEAELNRAFGLSPTETYASGGRPMSNGATPTIGILPLASSPLRTLPVETARRLVARLSSKGSVVLCLNRFQRQGQVYRRALEGGLPDGVRLIDAFDSIGDLLNQIRTLDYGVFADSGPAHMAKLFGTPGVAIYSSAPGDVLQGRFTNLVNWTVPYRGDWCESPCGLAKLRRTADGRVGCMGSLQVTLDDLPDIPTARDTSVVEKLAADPVPCIAEMARRADELADFVAADFQSRL